MERKARLEDGFASMRPIVSLSLFYVLFLSMESLLGERAATFLPPDAVAFAESVAAAASLVGFLLYALVRMRVPGFASLIHASGTLSAVGLLATSLVPGALTLLASGLATMLFVGFAGAAAHEALARRFADGPGIARAVGGAYAAGIVVQCLLMAVAPTPVVLVLLLAAPAAAMPVLAARCLGEDGVGLEGPPAPSGQGRPVRGVALLALLIALMTCVFSTVDVNLTSAQADGLADLGAWTRLFLAISALVAGEVTDRLDHRWEPGLMAVVTTLASFAVFAVLQGAPPRRQNLRAWSTIWARASSWCSTPRPSCSWRGSPAATRCGRAWAAPSTARSRSW